MYTSTQLRVDVTRGKKSIDKMPKQHRIACTRLMTVAASMAGIPCIFFAETGNVTPTLRDGCVHAFDDSILGLHRDGDYLCGNAALGYRGKIRTAAKRTTATNNGIA